MPSVSRAARITAGVVLAALGVAVSAAAAKDPPPIDLAGLLARVGERVEAYYARAQSILCLETVRLQPMDTNFTTVNHVRKLVYELRVSWDPATGDEPPEANVLRQLMSIDGRPPKPNEEPGCLDPKPVSLDPLSFLLPHHQDEYKFTYKGSGRMAGRAAVMVDFGPAGSQPPEIKWNDSCVSINVPARTKGRLWIDTATGDVLRIDETVLGPFDIEVPQSRAAEGRQRVAHARSRRFVHPVQAGALHGPGRDRAAAGIDRAEFRRFADPAPRAFASGRTSRAISAS